MSSGFITLAPYLLVGGGVAVAGLWLWRHRRSGDGGRASSAAAQGFAAMPAREFEALVNEAFRLQGYQVIADTHGDGHLALRRNRETVLVQCKHWKEAKVGVEAVHALQRAIAARGASAGFLLASGRFARDAIAFARSCNIRLIDGHALPGLLEKAKASRNAK